MWSNFSVCEFMFTGVYHNGIDTAVNAFYTRMNFVWSVSECIRSKINFVERKSSGNGATRPNKFCVIFVHSHGVSRLCAFSFSHGKKLSNKPLIRLKRYLSRYLNMSHTRRIMWCSLFSVGKFDMFVNSIWRVWRQASTFWVKRTPVACWAQLAHKKYEVII